MILNEADSTRRFEVYNFGLNGALSPFSVVNLPLHGVRYDPDLVIVYHGVNDLGALGRSSLRTDYHGREGPDGARWGLIGRRAEALRLSTSWCCKHLCSAGDANNTADLIAPCLPS